METNSKEYWNHRFTTDWISRQGQQQSAFFANIALGAFPEWLVTEINEKGLTICDWGCALGDGTNEIHHRFPQNALTGIDFSDSAIDKAKELYPDIEFIGANLLDSRPVHKQSYGLFFSSNTIEHFADPWKVLLRLSGYADKHLAVLVPYKEYERYPEHLYSFDEKNIPAKIGDSFLLTHIEIINGAGFTPNYWGALQVLLVYSQEKAIGNSGLKPVSDPEIRIVEGLYEQREILQYVKEIKHTLDTQFKDIQSNHDQEIAELKRSLAVKDEILLMAGKAAGEQMARLEEARAQLQTKTMLETQLAEKELLLNSRKEEISALNEEINSMKKEISARNEEINVSKKETHKQQEETTILKEEIKKLTLDLQAELSKLQKVIEENKNAFEQTNIWGLIKLKLGNQPLNRK